MENSWSHSTCWGHLCKTQKPKSIKQIYPQKKNEFFFSLNEEKSGKFQREGVVTKKIAQVSETVVVGRVRNFGSEEKEGDREEECSYSQNTSSLASSSQLLLLLLLVCHPSPSPTHHYDHSFFRFWSFIKKHSFHNVCVWSHGPRETLIDPENDNLVQSRIENRNTFCKRNIRRKKKQ